MRRQAVSLPNRPTSLFWVPIADADLYRMTEELVACFNEYAAIPSEDLKSYYGVAYQTDARSLTNYPVVVHDTDNASTIITKTADLDCVIELIQEYDPNIATPLLDYLMACVADNIQLNPLFGYTKTLCKAMDNMGRGRIASPRLSVNDVINLDSNTLTKLLIHFLVAFRNNLMSDTNACINDILEDEAKRRPFPWYLYTEYTTPRVFCHQIAYTLEFFIFCEYAAVIYTEDASRVIAEKENIPYSLITPEILELNGFDGIPIDRRPHQSSENARSMLRGIEVGQAAEESS